MKSSTYMLIFIVLIVLCGMLYYAHTMQNHGEKPLQSISINSGSSGYTIVAGGGNPGITDNVSMKIEYEVTGDSKVVSVAREFIRTHLPVPASLNREPPVDWVNANISVLKIVIKISNNNSIPVYYETNAFCGTSHWDGNSSNRTIFEWRVVHPIAVPEIKVYKGAVFPVPITCTQDLAYAEVPPSTTVSNEYYFVITKTFQGEIKASATVCLKPFSNMCSDLEGNIPVTAGSNR